MAGDKLISPQITVRLLRHLTRPTPDPRPHLTERERQVAELVAQGHGNAETGEALHISTGTAKNHVAALQRKLGARNRWASRGGRGRPACSVRTRSRASDDAFAVPVDG